MKAGVGAAMTRVELIGMVIGQVVVTAAEAQEAMGRMDAQKTVTRTVVAAVVVVVTVTVVEVHHVMKVAPETALVLMIAPVVAAVPPMIEWGGRSGSLRGTFSCHTALTFVMVAPVVHCICTVSSSSSTMVTF